MELEKQKRLAAIRKRLSEFKEFEEVTTAAVDSKWRSILSEQKLQQQKSSIDKIHASYVKEQDREDAVIERLLQWYDEGEAQYQFSLRSHQHNLDTLTSLAHRRLSAERERFDTTLAKISEESDRHHNRTLDTYNRHIAEVRDVKSAIEHEYAQLKGDIDFRFRTEKDSLSMKSAEALSALRTHLSEEITAITERQRKAHDDYKARCEGKMSQFNSMMEKHNKRQRTMKKNEAIILKQAGEIAHWKRKIKNNERESRESNERLLQEKENLSLHFRDLKDIMAKFRATETRKLCEVSVLFEDTINVLEKKLVLAEKILKYAEMTRKLETEREQVLPFPKGVAETDPEIQRQMQQFKLQLKGDPKYVGESDMFDKFYRRYNKVLLEKVALQRGVAQLQANNKRLKAMLKKQIAGSSITPDLANAPNTLLIINQNTNAPYRPPDSDSIPIIDAPTTIREIKLQGY